MLNHITIMGRLTRDPELRRTGSGVAVASFTVAVDRDFGKNENGENAVDSDVYVDGVRLGGHKGLTISGASTPITVEIDRFNIKTLKNISSKFYIDDLIFARTEQPLIEAKED